MSFQTNRMRHLDARDLGWGAMSQQTFTTKVMPMFGLALLMAAFGVYFGQTVIRTPSAMLGVVVAELVLVFSAGWWQRKEGLNKALFFLYALFSGMTLVPLLAVANAEGGLALIGQALTVTTVTFTGLAFYGLSTKRDFTNMGGYLFIGSLALIAARLLNAFVFHLGMLGLAVSVGGVGLFSAYAVYQMNMIRRAYSDADYIGAALGLFIDFVGLFSMILRLFLNVGGNRNN